MPHQFLSGEWIDAVRAIRDRHARTGAQAVAPSIRMNVVVSGAPFGDGSVRGFIDTSSGVPLVEIGELDDPDATVMTDYDTARSIVVTQDSATAMQAFMNGEVVVRGDMMKVIALPAMVAGHPGAAAIAAELRAITE